MRPVLLACLLALLAAAPASAATLTVTAPAGADAVTVTRVPGGPANDTFTASPGADTYAGGGRTTISYADRATRDTIDMRFRCDRRRR